MSINEIQVDTPPAAVWDVLADPPSYEEWVVGNKEVRDHDPSWPTVGTEFRHKVGFGPFTIKDKSVCLETQAPRRLMMHVRVLPVGHGIVTFELHEDGAGTRVRMEEQGAGGAVKLLWPLLDPLVKLRNAETLRRLKRLAESRHRAPAGRG
jgi:carbon monoxide dehydrogenase subunit G